MKDSAWAPLTRNAAGIWEIPPDWVAEHLGAVQIIDVREDYEFNGPLGRIPGAKLIPLGELEDHLSEMDRDKPVVAVCHVGGRSAQATFILQQAGFSKVANLPGGMMRWHAEGHEVEEGNA